MASHGQGQPLGGFQSCGGFAVHRPKPTQIVCEIAGGHAIEFPDPGFEAAMVSIDVLDVPSAIDADAGGQVYCMMLDTELAGSGRERRAAIGAQDQIGVVSENG